MKVKVFDLHKKLIKFQNFQLEVQKLNDSKKPNVVVMFNIGEHSQKLINEMKLMGYTCEKYSLLKDVAHTTHSGGIAGAPSGCAYLIFVNGIYRVDNSIQTYNTNSQYKTFVHYKLKTDDAKVFDFITTVFDDRIGIRKQQLKQLSNFASSCESGNVVVALLCNILPQHETSLETLFVIPGYHDAWFEKGTNEDICDSDNRSVRVWSSKLSSIISYSEHFIPGVNDDYDRYDEDFKMVEVVIE
jgi:hypothetical protein